MQRSPFVTNLPDKGQQNREYLKDPTLWKLPSANGQSSASTTKIIEGTVVYVRPFDITKSNFVISDNRSLLDDAKLKDYREIFYYSPDHKESLSPSNNLLSLPENDLQFKRMIVNLGVGIGGGSIVIDASKNTVPNKGDIFTANVDAIDKALPATIIQIKQSNSITINTNVAGGSLKQQFGGNNKLVSVDGSQDPNIEVPGENIPPAAIPDASGRIPFVGVPTQAFKKTIQLRKDAALAYQKIYKEVTENGGKMLISGGARSLNTKAGTGASKNSLHYIGRAFDIGVNLGFSNPEKDFYLVTVDENNRWQVWCKTNDSKFPEVEIDALYWQNNSGLSLKKRIKARIFSFTDIAKKYGFHRIQAWQSFYKNGGPYDEAEWWHFQYQEGLIAGESTYGEQMLLVYPKEQAEKFIYWDLSKDLTWTGHNFHGMKAYAKTKQNSLAIKKV